MVFKNLKERNRWLPRYLTIHNHRKHSALDWRSHQQRLCELLG